jgi:hypothetical protein
LSPVRRLHARGPRFLIAAGLALGLYAPMVLAQDVLIGMNDVHQPGGPDELVQVDRTTGVATRLHVFTSTGFNFLESLAYDARENVFWTTNDDVLIRVQPATFVTQVIGDTGVDDLDGLAVQPSTGALFGITYGGNDLVRIDKQDAGTTILNGHLEEGSRLEDLAFDSTGRLYVLTSRALVEVNPATGAKISKVTLNGATSLEGLVWDPQRGKFLSAADRGSSKDLVVIDRTTGQVTFFSPSLHSGFPDIEALAFAPGVPIVPVAMLAVASRRDDTGAWLAWEAFDAGITFVVERATSAAGPWQPLARVDAPIAGRSGSWQYEVRDPAAASAGLAGRPLHYRVGAADADGVWSYLTFELEAAAVRSAELHANAPNPFNPSTVFEVRLAHAGRVELTLFDVTGRVVRTIRTELGAGTRGVLWDGRDGNGRSVAGGVYPYVLAAGGQVLRGRAVLAK